MGGRSAKARGSPIATGIAVPMRLRTSWKISDSRSIGLTWLAIWNRAAVLSLEADRHDRCARPLDQLRREGLPRPVDRTLPSEPIRRRRDRAGRKDDHAASPIEMLAGCGPRREIGAEGDFGFGEVDGQDETGQFGCAQQNRIGENQEIRTNLVDEPGDYDAVEHAVGMVGHHDDGSDLGNSVQCRDVELNIDREASDRRREEVLAFDAVPTVGEIEAPQAPLPGRGFHEPDEAARHPRHRLVGVAEIRFAHAIVA